MVSPASADNRRDSLTVARLTLQPRFTGCSLFLAVMIWLNRGAGAPL